MKENIRLLQKLDDSIKFELNSNIEKFEYRSHEFIFSEEREISSAKLYKLLNRKFNKKATI